MAAYDVLPPSGMGTAAAVSVTPARAAESVADLTLFPGDFDEPFFAEVWNYSSPHN